MWCRKTFELAISLNTSDKDLVQLAEYNTFVG